MLYDDELHVGVKLNLGPVKCCSKCTPLPMCKDHPKAGIHLHNTFTKSHT